MEPTPEYRTRFERWLRENRYQDPQFARAIAKRLNVKDFSASTVRQWRTGLSCPRPHSPNMQAIIDLTGGAITYDILKEDQK